MIGLVSCQDNIDVVSYPSQDGNSFICLEERGLVDTLILLPYPIVVLQQNNTPDAISLIIETPQFFEYLLINRPFGKWQVDSVKSGPIISPIRSRLTTGESKQFFSFAYPSLIQYVTENNRTLNIPLRLIERKNPSWLYTKDVQAPPLPEIPLFQLEFELEVDSLNINRNKSVKILTSRMEKSCLSDSSLSDSSLLVIQFIIDPTGELSKFRVVKDMTPDQRLNEKIVSCLEDVINELNLNFGELKSIPSARGQAIKVQHTIPLRGSRKVRSNSRSLQG